MWGARTHSCGPKRGFSGRSDIPPPPLSLCLYIEISYTRMNTTVVLILSYVWQSLRFVATFLDVVVERLLLDWKVLVACVQVLGMLNGVVPSLLLHANDMISISCRNHTR